MAQARNSSADKKSPSYFDGRHRFRGEAGVPDRVTSTAGSGLFLFLGSNLETTPARRSRRTGRDLTIQQSVRGSLRMTLRNYRSSITGHSSNSLRRLLGCAIVIFASEEFLKKSYRSIALEHEVRDISVMTPILLKVRSVLIKVKKEHRPPRKWRPVAKARLARTGT